jgi:hypothetical protein
MVSDAVLSELTFNQRAPGSSPGRLTKQNGHFPNTGSAYRFPVSGSQVGSSKIPQKSTHRSNYDGDTLNALVS